MKAWRRLIGLLPWLLAPSFLAVACGRTEEAGADPSAPGGVAASAASSAGAFSVGGRSPEARGGAFGRAGNGPIAQPGAAGFGADPSYPPGISNEPTTLTCGLDTCSSLAVGPAYTDACCAGDVCGLQTGFLALLGVTFADACQARAQAGSLDASCPASGTRMLTYPAGSQTTVPIEGFAGCCRENGKCGVALERILAPGFGKLAELGLGCVDSAPFFGGAAAPDCGATGGAGGASFAGDGGASGAGGASFAGEGGAAVSAGGAG